jgi:hypothetical protein
MLQNARILNLKHLYLRNGWESEILFKNNSVIN